MTHTVQVAPFPAAIRRESAIEGRLAQARPLGLARIQGGERVTVLHRGGHDGVDFNLASMPESFNVPLRYSFDPRHMNALFELGYKLGKEGYPWAKAPPSRGGATQSQRGPRPQRDEAMVKWAKIQRRWDHPLSSHDA